jgi:HD domain
MAGRTRGHRRRADELTCTESEALNALRTATGEIDGDMERHTVRQYLIAERLADTRRIAYDRELLLCASFLHDAGLYGPASSGDVYGHPRPRREGVIRSHASTQASSRSSDHRSGSSVRRA